MSRSNTLSMYKTTIRNVNQFTIIRYHKTDIVKFERCGDIVLDFGGYDTVTTRRKMNQASKQFGLGYSVFRHKGQTYVNSDGDLDVSQSVQYCGYPIVIGANKGYGMIRDVA
jgi:hypothetical protein